MQNAVIKRLSKELNKEGIIWGIGGSHVLNKHGLGDEPNDIDLLIRLQEAGNAVRILDRLAERRPADTKPPFKTTLFRTYQKGDVSIDFMAGFAIEHDSGVYEMRIDEGAIFRSDEVPYTSLEDWYVLYQLISKKGEKADLIESYWKENGVEFPHLLERALHQPLPDKVKQRIEKSLSYKR